MDIHVKEMKGDMNNIISIRKGAWSCEEDSILINYIAVHGYAARWNQLACNAGLKRTGKSCRLRWLNYLCPNIRRGNFTPQEQLYIMQLHCFYGNRWSKIAEYLPGRTDNDIKNYWRTRVYKLAKLLKCHINSTEFRDFITNIWIPRLSEQVVHDDDDGLMKITVGPDYWAEDILPEPIKFNPASIEDMSGPPHDQDFFCSLQPFISYGSFDHGIEETSFNYSDNLFWF